MHIEQGFVILLKTQTKLLLDLSFLGPEPGARVGAHQEACRPNPSQTGLSRGECLCAVGHEELQKGHRPSWRNTCLIDAVAPMWAHREVSTFL